jgi:hypothetical protein
MANMNVPTLESPVNSVVSCVFSFNDDEEYSCEHLLKKFTTILGLALFVFHNLRRACCCLTHRESDADCDCKYAVSYAVTQSDCAHTS